MGKMSCLNSNPKSKMSLVCHLWPNKSMQVVLNYSYDPWTVC